MDLRKRYSVNKFQIGNNHGAFLMDLALSPFLSKEISSIISSFRQRPEKTPKCRSSL